MPILQKIPSNAAPWYAAHGPAGEAYAAIESMPNIGQAINANARALNALSQRPGMTADAEFQRAMRDHASAVQGYLDAAEAIENALTLAVERGYITAEEARNGVQTRQAPSALGGPSAGTVFIVSVVSAAVIVGILMVFFSVSLPVLLVVLVAMPVLVTTLTAVDNAIAQVNPAILNLSRRTVNQDGTTSPSPIEQVGGVLKSPVLVIGALLAAAIVIPRLLKKGGNK